MTRTWTRWGAVVCCLLLAVVFGGYGSSAAAPAAGIRVLNLSIGRQPYAGANSPITQYMIDHHLVETYGSRLGYTLHVQWRDYPSAIPMVTDMLGNRLDIGMWGDTPIIRALATHQPVTVLSMGEGHLEFFLITRKGSGIRNFHDLKGKTVGVLLGGDPNFAFTEMLRYTLGSANPQQLGIRLINTPTQAEAGSLPAGMDASIVILPEYLKAHAADPDIVAIANSFGYTESYYEGSAGTGAGHLIPNVKQSPFYPEGFYLHRSFWIARTQLVQQHPRAIQAFVEAEQAALAAEMKMAPGAVSQLVNQYWKLPAELGAQVVKRDLLFIRGWIWPTQGDYFALVAVSENLVKTGAVSQPLTWPEVEANAKLAAPILQAAYTAMGSWPPASVFTQKAGVHDFRGYPAWEISRWNTSHP